jgi:hypothetical protein
MWKLLQSIKSYFKNITKLNLLLIFLFGLLCFCIGTVVCLIINAQENTEYCLKNCIEDYKDCEYLGEYISHGVRFTAFDEYNKCMCDDGSIECTQLDLSNLPVWKAESMGEQMEDKKAWGECLLKEGHWMGVGGPITNTCNLPTSDAGKKCESRSECESDCITVDNVEIGEQYVGECHEYQMTVGCFFFIEGGIVESMSCYPAWLES